MELFKRLGDDIELAWRDLNFDELALPGVAKQKLAEFELPVKVSPWDVVAWTLARPQLPHQHDVPAAFGEPPITIYNSNRFHIDIYFWFTGTTATHQHGFSGAFQVMTGSSIHSTFRFTEDDAVNEYMKFGALNLDRCELLEAGDIQEIWPGERYIHSLFHLDEPSVTIVVRTKKSPRFQPQYSYERPFLAIDPFFKDDTITKKIQVIAALIRAKRPETDELLELLIEESDIHSTFIYLSHIRPMLAGGGSFDSMFKIGRTGDRYAKLLDAARKRHGTRADRLDAVFRQTDQINAIIKRRAYVTDPELRYFLAVLLNAENRENVYKLVKARFPDADPQEKILDWTYDLSTIRVMGLDPPNALGIEDFGDVDVVVLEELLNGKDETEIADSLKAAGAADAQGLAGRIERITDSPVLATLFRAIKTEA